MKLLKKTSLIIAGLIAITLLSVGASGTTVNDDTDDVWVYELGGSGMAYRQYSGSRDNVDVTSVSYEISGSTVTASLTVEGEIQNDMYHTYIIYLENSSGQYYATYSAGSGMWIGNNKYSGEMGQLTDPVSGDTFTAIFDINHPEDSFDIYGMASESVDATEAYYDYAPDMFAPYYQDSSGDDGTEPEEEDDPSDNGWGDIPNDMDDMMNYTETTTDPSSETPTDTSIQVSIDSANYDFSSSDNKSTVDMRISGTTSGVDHCKICLVNYYSDGTTDEQYVWTSGFDMTSYLSAIGSFMGETEFEAYHFKSLSDNWQTWEYKIKGTLDTSYSETSPLVSEDVDSNKTLSKTEVFVRAYKDANGTLWNQDSYSINTLNGSNSSDDGSNSSDDDGSGSGIPGFETVFLIAAIGIALILLKRKNKK